MVYSSNRIILEIWLKILIFRVDTLFLLQFENINYGTCNELYALNNQLYFEHCKIIMPTATYKTIYFK